VAAAMLVIQLVTSDCEDAPNSDPDDRTSLNNPLLGSNPEVSPALYKQLRHPQDSRHREIVYAGLGWDLIL
jgi:hypothetical protein